MIKTMQFLRLELFSFFYLNGFFKMEFWPLFTILIRSYQRRQVEIWGSHFTDLSELTTQHHY